MKLSKENSPLIIGMLIAVIYISTGYLRIDSMWGTNHLKYFPEWSVVLFSLICLILLFKIVSNTVYIVFNRVADFYNNLPIFVRVTLCFAITIAILYSLKVHVHTLGDGYLRVFQIDKGFSYYRTEPLDFYLHAFLFDILNRFMEMSAESVYVWFSISFGSIFVVTLFEIKLPNMSMETSRIAKIMIFTLAGSQMFFGYVESYSLIYPLVIVFTIIALRGKETCPDFFVLSILTAAAVSAHLIGAMLIPAYIYLIFRFFRYHDNRQKLINMIGPIIVLTVMAVIAYFDYKDYQLTSELRTPFFKLFLTPFGDYGIITPAHLLDIVNQALLAMPAVICTLPLISIAKPSRIFYALLLFPPILMIFILDPMLGFVRDWDLMAVPSAIIAVTLIIIIFNGEKLSQKINQSLKSVSLLGVAFFGLWIATNFSEPRQLTRAENTMLLSSKGQGYGLELLAHHYSEKLMNNNEALRVFNLIEGGARNQRVLYKIARLNYEDYNYSEAIETAREGLTIDSLDGNLLMVAGCALLGMNEPLKALEYLYPASRIKFTEAMVLQQLGEAYRRVDSLSHAIHAYRRALIIEPGHIVTRYNMAYSYYQLGQLDSALANVRMVLDTDRNYRGAQELYNQILSLDSN